MKKFFSMCLMSMAVATMSAQPFSVTPEAGSQVDALASVILTLDPDSGYTHFEINTADDIYFTFNGERFCDASCEEVGRSLEILATDIIWESGEYAVIIEPYAISWANDDYSMFADNDKQLVFSYMLGGGGQVSDDFPFTIDPAPGKVESLEEVTFTVKYEEGYEWFDVDSYEAYFTRDGEWFCGVNKTESSDYLRMTISPLEAITEDGEYALVFPGYTFICSNEENDPFYINYDDLVFSYTVGEGGDTPAAEPFTVTPASGSKVTTLEEVVFTVNYEEGYEWFDVESYEAYFTRDGEWFCGVNKTESSDYLRMTITPLEPITESGEYALVFRAYTFICSNEANDPFYINYDDLVFNYTISGEAAGVVYDVVPTSYKPANESVIDLEEKQFDSVEIFFSSDNIMPREGATIEIIPVGYESQAFETSNLKAIASMKKILVGFAGVGEIDQNNEIYGGIEYNGVYEVIIPKGTFGDEAWINDPATGHSNDEIILTYEVIGGMERPGVAYTVEPVSVSWTEDLKSFTLTFEEGISMIPYAFATLDCIEAKYAKYAEFKDNGDSTFTVEFDEAPSANGNYVFNVEQGMFGNAEFVADEVSGVANAEISKVIEFIYTGVNTVISDNVKEGVYNLFGVKVADTTDNLPAGIYIVGGKKIIVK
ncbi:MAG: hypothetical protein HDR88_02540 [Bacteroides sp.]|nr:hypothetical protein [Bacteroides sp.]